MNVQLDSKIYLAGLHSVTPIAERAVERASRFHGRAGTPVAMMAGTGPPRPQDVNPENSMSNTNFPNDTPADTKASTSAAIGAAAASADAAIDSAAAAERDVMRRVVQGAHEAIDRIADKAIPAVERLKGTYNDASEALQQRAGQAVELKDEWTESVRAVVREHPLAALATALAVGAIIARLTASNDDR